MSVQMQFLYSQKLSNLQIQFTRITRAYSALVTENAAKDAIISNLTSSNESLKEQLRTAQAHIELLLSKLKSAEPVQVVPKGPQSSEVFTSQNTQILEKENKQNNIIKIEVKSACNQREISRRQNAEVFQDTTDLADIGRLLAGLKEKTNKSIANQPLKPLDNVKKDQNEDKKPAPKVVQDNVRVTALKAIWEQRDKQIGKMDQLFENLKQRLKDYE